jgi:large subunit ribosomal protein L15
MSQILYAIFQGRIDPKQPITIKAMRDARLFKTAKYGVKVLARGAETLKDLEPLHLEVSDASASVISAIKELGGTVKCIYRTPLLMREHLKPQAYDLQLRDPIPPSYKLKQFDRIAARGAEVLPFLDEQRSSTTFPNGLRIWAKFSQC